MQSNANELEFEFHTDVTRNNSNGGAFNSVRRSQQPLYQQARTSNILDEASSATTMRPTKDESATAATTNGSCDGTTTDENSPNGNAGGRDSDDSPSALTAGKEMHITFQPVNTTSGSYGNRPKSMGLYQTQLQQQQQQQQQPSISTGFKPTIFKRDLIAEKKRSSIGKSPHNNYYVCHVRRQLMNSKNSKFKMF